MFRHLQILHAYTMGEGDYCLVSFFQYNYNLLTAKYIPFQFCKFNFMYMIFLGRKIGGELGSYTLNRVFVCPFHVFSKTVNHIHKM